MKEFVFAYNDGKLARFEGTSEEDAKKKLLANVPDAKVTVAVEVDDTLDKLLNVIHHAPDTELEQIAAEVASTRKARDAEARKEELRKSKFKKYQNNSADAGINDAWRETLKGEVLKNAEKGELTRADWNKLLTALGQDERQKLYDEYVEDAKKTWGNDTTNLEREILCLNYMFGMNKGKWKKNNRLETGTVRDLAKIMDISHVRVQAIQKQALLKFCKEIGRRVGYPLKIKDYKQALELLMGDAKKKGK